MGEGPAIPYGGQVVYRSCDLTPDWTFEVLEAAAQSSHLAILPTGARSNRGKITVKVVSAYLHLVVLTVTGWPASTDGLDGSLARLQQRPRREDAPFKHARRVWRPAGAASCSGLVPRCRRRALPR